MSLQSINIQGFESGVQKNKKPFLLMDDAFSNLYNAYTYRQEVRKREGLQFIGRYRRVLTDQSQTNADGTSDYDIADILSGVRVTETNAELEPGSIVIIVDDGNPNETQFTDQGDGTFSRTSGAAFDVDPGTFVNYVTGQLHIEWDAGGTPGAGITIDLDYNYFPALPAMGIPTRELSAINEEQAVFFDTKYAYIHDGGNFQEFLPASAATWNGTDSDFFWATNYRGSDTETRNFFVTNFVNDAGSPMRYTTGSAWTTFQPCISGTQQTEVLSTTLASGSAAYGPDFLTNLPIIQGTIVITVSHNGGTENDIVFRDTPKDGTLVSTGSNSGTINYTTGEINLSFSPVLPGAGNWTVTSVYDDETNYIFTARILIPYYGRLLALNTWEGATSGGAISYFNRCRFSQVGNPVQQDAWRSDVFGKGGFLDAPTNQAITGAIFYKNTLIVTFERSTWRLQYIGEYGLPFIWERISSDFGSESTFSSVLFDDGVLSVGDKAIVSSSGGDVQRIDLDIPDTVYSFRNADNGVKRVQGIRDFRKELVFWCFSDVSDFYQNEYYPDKTLVFNYRNNTFAFFRNNVTCFGNFQYPAEITWDRLDIYWSNENITWDTGIQKSYPTIACGNQQGFAHFYGYPDAETSVDSTINAMDQESLAVKSVTIASANGPVTLEIPNHNLKTDEIIYLTGLIYLVTANSTPGTTNLNDQIYSVRIVDEDNVILSQWDQDVKESVENFSATSTGTYIGGGVVALFPKIEIETKDFNPAKQIGQNIKTSYVDFLFDTSSSTAISVEMKMNTNSGVIGNVLVGNTQVETANVKFGNIYDVSLTNPCVIESENHGLLDGAIIQISDVQGTTELNGNQYNVTFLTTNTFSINVDATAFTAYSRSGYWSTMTAPYFTLNSQYGWHRFFATCFGQYLRLLLTYNEEQMFQLRTHQQNFVLNAMQIYFRTGGKNIFGK